MAETAGGETKGEPYLVGETGQWPTSREMLLLLILAAVQFTHIVDFMIVMPLGPVLRREMA